jgi:hypothetical protein
MQQRQMSADWLWHKFCTRGKELTQLRASHELQHRWLMHAAQRKLHGSWSF